MSILPNITPGKEVVNGTYLLVLQSRKAVKFLGYDYKPIAVPRNLACK
jgi:hypothetical protein